jgi:hypothetical protein
MDLRKDIYFYADLASFPASGAANLLYVDSATSLIYIWNGASYVASGAGGLKYGGLWNAATNNPTITSGVGDTGEYYIVGTAGTTSIDGINDWAIGDWIIFGGSAWQKIDNSDREGYNLIQEEGVSLPKESTIDFVGAGVSASAGSGKTIITIPGSIGATTYYLNESVTQAPYKEFTSTLTASLEQTIVTSIASGATVTIQSFQTPSGVPGTTNIPGGRWAFYLHFSGTTGDSWDVFTEVYKRDLGGIETLLLTTDAVPTSTLTGAAVMLLTDGVFPTSTVLTTDRIVVKVRVTNTDSTTNSITFHTEGNTNYSIGTTTLNQVVPTGAVTSVTGTAPIASSGGTAPAISISQSGAASDGYLSSTDWNTFNNKVDDNIYTADGTLTGNRIVDLDGKNLNFSDNVGNSTMTNEINDGSDYTTLVQDISALVLQAISGGYNSFSNVQGTQINMESNDGGTNSSSMVYQAFYTEWLKQNGIQFTKIRQESGQLFIEYNDGIGNIRTFTVDAGGLEINGAYYLPNSDGTLNQILTTDGAGVTSWQNADNIYSADGTVSGDRQVDLAGNDLFFNDGFFASTFRFNSDDGSSSTLIDASPSGITLGTSGGGTGKAININTTQISLDGKFTVDNTKNTSGQNLEVDGQTKTTTFQLTTAPTAGYVLTSDASGNGTWQAASGGVNIYNTDGTLTADRTVTMNNFGLTFNGAGGTNGSQINITSAANRSKALNFQVGSGLRWKQQVSGVEIGGDNGSQLSMLYYDDAGVLKGTAFSISRTNGAFRLNNAYSLPISGGTTGQVLTSTTLGLTEFQSLPAEIQAAASDETTNLTTGTAKVTFRMPHAMTLTAVRASLTTAQTAGALLTVDINLNGASVLGTKLTFDNNERTTVTAATPATIVTSALTDDGEITVDIDAVGTAGARGLKITLIGTRA